MYSVAKHEIRCPNKDTSCIKASNGFSKENKEMPEQVSGCYSIVLTHWIGRVTNIRATNLTPKNTLRTRERERERERERLKVF